MKVSAHGKIGDVSIHDIRQDFPILHQKSDSGEEICYLDSAATSQKPDSVIEAISRYYRSDNANVHRAVHSLAARATASYENGRSLVAQFINSESAEEIVFTKGTTESINLVAKSWGKKLNPGDEVLLSEMEHHSNLIPWQLLAEERGIGLRFIPFLDDGTLDLENIHRYWSESVKFVSLTHMSNVFGTINEVSKVISFAHNHGVPVLIDGAQAVPHMPVDVRELDCDFYAFSGHKMCGPTGIGALYGKKAILDTMDPFMGGGEMITAVWLDRARWNEVPYKFEAGTPNIAGAVGLGAAIEYLSSIGMNHIHGYESDLAAYAADRLKSVPGIIMYGNAPERGAVISFNIEGVHAHDVAQFLDSRGIAVRAGHHCAHPVMRKLGVSSTVRASFYLYNSQEDADRLESAVRKSAEFFSHGV